MRLKCVVFVLWLIFAKISCEEFETCPSIAIGYPPFCVCRHGPPYDNSTNACPNPECPPKSIAQPAYPNCTCTEKNFDYGAYINECFRVCPSNSSGYWPNCRCDNQLAIFDKRMRELKLELNFQERLRISSTIVDFNNE